MSLFDYLFPKRCVSCRKFGSYICPNCFSYISFMEHGICVVCQRPAIGGMTHPRCLSPQTIDGVFSSLVYTGVTKRLVYTFKYRPHITNMQTLLCDLLYEGLIQKDGFHSLLTTKSALVPIPLHRSRLKSRGYNQSLLLAKGLAKYLNLPVLDGLERVKNTHTQVGLSQEKRRENMKDAFVLKKVTQEQMRSFSQVFLIDDVATSGATVREAAKVLKKAGVQKVWGITLAHGI